MTSVTYISVSGNEKGRVRQREEEGGVLCIVSGGWWARRGSVNGKFKLKFRISSETNSGTLTVDWEGEFSAKYKIKILK